MKLADGPAFTDDAIETIVVIALPWNPIYLSKGGWTNQEWYCGTRLKDVIFSEGRSKTFLEGFAFRVCVCVCFH